MKLYNYVYRITNMKSSKHYYGVRSSKVEPKLDLGIKYFSSSSDKKFIKEQKENKSIFKYKIIKIYKTREEATNLEIKLHDKFDVAKNEMFYNKSKQTSCKFDTSGTKLSKEHIEKIKNYKLTEEQKMKHKLALIGRKHSEETKLKMSNSAIGKKKSEKAKENMRKPKTEEHKKKLKEVKSGENNPMFGKKQKKLICPHCNRLISVNVINQFHNDKCKQFK